MIDIYIDYLTHLKTYTSNGFKVPYKPVLLIAITKLIRDGVIKSSVIVKDDTLSRQFVLTWNQYIQINTPFVGQVETPFRTIASEKFVKLISSDVIEIDEELFTLMNDLESSEKIISTLVSTYLTPFAFQHRVSFS